MSTDTAHLTFERRFSLSADQLWHLLTDPQMRAAWGAPAKGVVMTPVTADFRVGGIERHRLGPADAPEFEAETRWYRIDTPQDAVFTETIEVGGAPIATSLVTYRLVPDPAGSVLHVAVGLSSFVGAEAMGEFEQGWQTGLDNLEKLAKSKG